MFGPKCVSKFDREKVCDRPAAPGAPFCYRCAAYIREHFSGETEFGHSVASYRLRSAAQVYGVSVDFLVNLCNGISSPRCVWCKKRNNLEWGGYFCTKGCAANFALSIAQTKRWNPLEQAWASDDTPQPTPAPQCATPKRVVTKSEVLRQRRQGSGGSGCCDRYANMMRCDCLENAPDYRCSECSDSGYTLGGPMNGWNRAPYKRCPNGCPVQCNICSSPDCDNPNGQH
jgi:hypothetical protein